MKKIIAIIPARGGSKGIPGKNIMPLGGFPVIAFSIAACVLSEKIERIVVSTDSEEVAETGRYYGAEVPFLRPKNFATDASPDIDFVKHALSWFEENEGSVPDYLVHIRPTTPLRDPVTIDAAIEKIIADPRATALRSVHEVKESPYKLFEISNARLVGMFPYDPRPEYYNLPRQEFPPVYQPNGYVDIIKTETVIKIHSLHGPEMLAHVTEDTGELDNAEDCTYVEYMLKKKQFAIYEYLVKQYGKSEPEKARSL